MAARIRITGQIGHGKRLSGFQPFPLLDRHIGCAVDHFAVRGGEAVGHEITGVRVILMIGPDQGLLDHHSLYVEPSRLVGMLFKRSADTEGQKHQTHDREQCTDPKQNRAAGYGPQRGT